MNRQGSSLIELMVTLAAGGIIVAAGMAAVGQLAHARSTHVPDDEIVSVTIRRSLAGWLQAARGGANLPFEAVDRVHGGTPDDELTFVTASANPWSTGESRIRLMIDRDPMASVSGLAAEIEPLTGLGMRRIRLVQHATGLDVRYRANASDDWQAHWSSPAELPYAVDLTLFFDDAASMSAMSRLPIIVVFEAAQ